MIDCFFEDAFEVLSCPFWSTVLQCGARLTIHTLNFWSVLSVVPVFGGVFECDLSLHRSVAVLCMLYKIRYNPMHPLYCALPESYVPVRVTRGAVVVHRCTYAPPRYRTSHVPQDFYFPFSIPMEQYCWPSIRWCGTGGFQEHGHCHFIGLAVLSLFVSYHFSLSLLSF